MYSCILVIFVIFLKTYRALSRFFDHFSSNELWNEFYENEELSVGTNIISQLSNIYFTISNGSHSSHQDFIVHI